jgi:activator of HSP90 ATPase
MLENNAIAFFLFIGGVVGQFQGIEKKKKLVEAIPKCPWPGKPCKHHAM